ncbi:DUF590-domain-containing protein [Piromyces finnis]|uniref:DUF590-domain-containing protein n=1 Tax=Piromyces finnis TaxID=1754191 RepID=A0A1Y1VKF1_9FUNG|nr:DUF590-domain-containing protein [Piromyces finnis]|eukprot:ORX58560.1 DUF590-domain-containing protein [Piromyces finnis]
MESKDPKSPISKEAFTSKANDIDYVLIFNTTKNVIPPKEIVESEDFIKGINEVSSEGKQFSDQRQLYVLYYWKNLCKILLAVGLEFKVKKLKEGYLALCLHCPEDVLAVEYYKFRVQEYLRGIGVASADFDELDINDPDVQKSIAEKLPTSDRLYIIYNLLTRPTWEGGVGISTETEGGWHQTGGMYLESFFTLHNKELNNKWIKHWSKKYILSTDDMTDIRNHFGTRVSYYFAFLQKYFMSLLPPAIVGLLAFFFDRRFSIFYGIFIVLYGIFFIILWNRHADQLAILWNVKNCSTNEKVRPEFRPQKMVKDKVTGDYVPYYPNWKRWVKRVCLTYPFIFLCAIFTVMVFFCVICIEIWVRDLYQGPFKTIMVYIPTAIYSTFIPFLNGIYLSFARKFNNFENYVTKVEYDNRYAEKVFVFYFLNSFMSLIVVGWAYIPFSKQFISLLKLTPLGSLITDIPLPGPERLVGNYVYVILTGQVLNLFQETIIPYLSRKITGAAFGAISNKDKDEEKDTDPIVKQIEKEMELPIYDVNDDYSEMVVQFGYVSLFSIVWPLGSVISFINNWVELRSDAVKMCINYRRPYPQRSENIGPWIGILSLLSWLSSLTNAWFVSVFRYWEPRDQRSTTDINYKGLVTTLAIVIISEHLYFLIKILGNSFFMECVPGKRDHIVKKAEMESKNRILRKVGICGSQIDLIKTAESPEFQLKQNTSYGIALNAIYEKFNKENSSVKENKKDL